MGMYVAVSACFNFTCNHVPPGNLRDKSSPSVPGVGNCLKSPCPQGVGVGQIELLVVLVWYTTSRLVLDRVENIVKPVHEVKYFGQLVVTNWKLISKTVKSQKL